MTPKQVYKKAMLAWVKEIIQWQLKNPDRDWATALFGVETNDAEGGDRPPLPPPKP